VTLKLTWVLGYLFAAILIGLGLSKGTRLKVASKQIFVAVGIFVLIAMTALVLDDLSHWSERFPNVSLAILGCLIVLYRGFSILWPWSRGGSILLNLGRVPASEFVIEMIVAAALAANAIIDGVKEINTSGWVIDNISFEVLELSVAFAVFVQGILRRNVREKGIFHGTGLVPWEKIESYGWEGQKGRWLTLILQKQSPVALLRTVTLSVSTEHVEALEKLMKQHNVAAPGEPPPTT
jgi:hypothetical protein